MFDRSIVFLAFIITAVCETAILWIMQIVNANFYILLAVIFIMVILNFISLKNLSKSDE